MQNKVPIQFFAPRLRHFLRLSSVLRLSPAPATPPASLPELAKVSCRRPFRSDILGMRQPRTAPLSRKAGTRETPARLAQERLRQGETVLYFAYRSSRVHFRETKLELWRM